MRMCTCARILVKLIACLLFLLTSALPLCAQILPPDTAFYSRYPFIRMLDVDEAPATIDDEDFFQSAAKVTFPVNKTTLRMDSLLRELDKVVIPRLNADSLQLLRVFMRGAASPEGPLEFNRRLGRQRAQSFKSFLAQRLRFPLSDDVLMLENDVEDYRTLCLMMRSRSDADYRLVQSLCDEYLPKQNLVGLKSRLRAAKGGWLWSRLLRQYFPQLRAARLMLYFRKFTPPTPPVEAELQEKPKQTEAAVVEEMAPPPDTLWVTPPIREPRRELLSVKTNLLMYGIYMPGYDRWCPMPNVAVEYYPTRGHFTFGASLDLPWWQHYDKHKFFQIRNWQVETRYYLRSGNILDNPPGQGAAFRGLYLQAYVHTGVFGICFNHDRGWTGEGVGGGVGAGYVIQLSRRGHWRLELGAQVGYLHCIYDPYQYENMVDPSYHDDLYYYKWAQKAELFRKRQYRWNWIGPTRVGITLTYDLLYRRIRRGGMSLNAWEGCR